MILKVKYNEVMEHVELSAEAKERILPTMDREVSQNLGMVLKKRGISIHTSATVEEITTDGGMLCCQFSKGD